MKTNFAKFGRPVLSIFVAVVFLSLFGASQANAYKQKFVVSNSFRTQSIIVALESSSVSEGHIERMALDIPTPQCLEQRDGSWIIGALATCNFRTVYNIHAQWRMCADPLTVAGVFSGMIGVPSGFNLKCYDGRHTRVEVSEGLGSQGTNLDISVFPSGNTAGVACNDPQWGNCPFNNSDQLVNVPSMGGNLYCSQLNPNQPEAQGCTTGSITQQAFCSGAGKAAYNIGVTASCHTKTNNYNRVITLTCLGTPTLGTAGYPSKCGFATLQNQLNNCIGDGGTNCYQALFSPMSQGSTTSYTQNGQYYCGFSNLQQPDITCSSQATPINISFHDPNQ